MDLTRLVLLVLAFVVVALASVACRLRSRALNKRDPLQDRLVEHLDRYVSSDRGSERKTALTEALRDELRGRQVPREEWRDRLSAAFTAINHPKTSSRAQIMSDAEDLFSVLERLGKSI